MNKKKITSLEIKHALMYYFRFKRQWICASEYMDNDVMAIAANNIVIETEIKINKYDLWKGEEKKNKHKQMNNPTGWFKRYLPNKFYMCVPLYLFEEAKLWVEQTNKKYGIIIYHSEHHISCAITIAKSASRIHEANNENLDESIMMRVCAENIGLMERLLEKKQ